MEECSHISIEAVQLCDGGKLNFIVDANTGQTYVWQGDI